ncbi:MAG: hypothetical protein QM617_07775 [Comamonas sp.]
MQPESSSPAQRASIGRHGSAAALLTAAVLGLAGCAAPLPAPPPPQVVDTRPAQTERAPTTISASELPAPPPPDPAYVARRELVTRPLIAVLNYADKIRTLGAADIAREIAQLNPLAERPDPDVQPQRQLQLALALAQTRNLPDLVRAIGLTQRVQEVRTPVTQQLQPLARLLQQRYTEQRRVEDLNERQAQLLRDTQRRLEAALDRMEALKAIERSLYNSRGGTSAPSPRLP